MDGNVETIDGFEEHSPAAILVADPDPTSLELIVRTAFSAGYRCDAYPNLDSCNGALDRLAATPAINVVVVDSRALDRLEDGPSLAALRRHSLYQHAIQFLVIGQPEHLDQVLHNQVLEAEQIAAKPVDQQTLRLAIRWAVRKHLALRSISGTAPFEALSQSRTRVCRESASDLRILHWMRELDEQRVVALEGAIEPDATWNMLAELLRARITGKRISVTSLCLASGGPVTSALRRIERLLDGGLIVRTLDPVDGRRKYLNLTPEDVRRTQAALKAAHRYWAAVKPRHA